MQKIEPPHKPEGAKGGVSDTYHDLGEKGLILIVSHGGAKTFYLYMKINGVPKRVKIGAFPHLSIEQARKQAQSLKGQIAQGDDPTDAAKQQKEEYSLKRFFMIFILSNTQKAYSWVAA